MLIPIIVIHLAEREHLRWTLAQARVSNPESNVILISDRSTSHYNFVQHENITNYFDEAENFRKIYKHFSANSLSYELLCFQRWFILKSFMVAKNIERCLCMDSDVMLYVNVTKEQNRFEDFDFTLSQRMSPHCVFINRLNALRQFCGFLTELYTNSASLEEMRLVFDRAVANNLPGISDMTAFRRFADSEVCRIGETSTIVNNSTYDHNINCSEGFETCDDRKNIYFLEDKPFCRHLSSNREIKFNTLHLQGYAKEYVKEYFRGDANLIEAKVTSFETDTSSHSLGRASNDNYTYVVLPFKLGEINIIIFPDWLQLETLYLELEKVLGAIATHPDNNRITLLVDTSTSDREEVNLVLSGLMLDLMLQLDGEITEEPKICLVEQLSELQWNALLNLIQTRIIIKGEDKRVIAAVKADKLPSHNLEDFSRIRFN